MILCTIGSSYYAKLLCDLGTSVNLIPPLVFRKLGLGEPNPTMTSLQFVNSSIKHLEKSLKMC